MLDARLKAVIKKALVQLEGAPYQALVTHKATWAQHDCYRYVYFQYLVFVPLRQESFARWF